MARYKIYDNKSDVITPVGEKLTAEQWLDRYQWGRYTKMIVGGGIINGSVALVFDDEVERYRKAGCDFSACVTDEDYLAALRALAPGRELWKAFKIRSEDDLAAAAASTADQILLDNGYGTGQTFDWSLAGGVRRPFLLAGGLTPENIPNAVAQLHPMGLDLSSGVETDRQKDRTKILAAVAAARKE